MPKYLVHASYTADGVQGVAAKGGSARVEAIRAVAESLGGTLECFYFAFGKDDVVTIVDLPDNASAAAVALTVGGSGLVSTRTTVLLTAEEIDAAAQKSVDYRAPGR